MLLAEIWDVLERRVFPIPSTDRLFNPYRDGAPDLDREDAPAIRRENVRAYLAAYDTMPDVLLLAEAPGPWGCRFSGVPITCEAQLLDPATRYTSTIRRGAISFKGPAFDVDGTIVWGFTAMVLDRLFDACGWTVPWDVTDERPVEL